MINFSRLEDSYFTNSISEYENVIAYHIVRDEKNDTILLNVNVEGYVIQFNTYEAKEMIKRLNEFIVKAGKLKKQQ